jgi:3-deoxy-7-phosphoheptulonate synthase
MENNINNINILNEQVVLTPNELHQQLPCSKKAIMSIGNSRETIENILLKKDHRIMVIVGPCSIHDIEAAKEYAQRLVALQQELKDSVYLVMRVYFEKPRTTVGWKGLISDPAMDNSFDVNRGLYQGREFLLWLAELGMPVATEVLDPITPQYLADLISWSAIGARTTESQTHRELSSGLSMPIGFKNGTDGNLGIAINAIKSSSSAQSFLGINKFGQVTRFKTRGNQFAHIILRGGKQPNYDRLSVLLCEKEFKQADLPIRILIDCSHGNSRKDYKLQRVVIEDISQQIINGNQSIVGIMIESNLHAGNQPLLPELSEMQYGVSVTDACIDWEETDELLRKFARQLKGVLESRRLVT